MTEPALIERCARALYRAANEGDVSNAALDATFAAAEHSGDCTQECHTCLRCEAEWARGCARAVLAEFLAVICCDPTEAMLKAGRETEPFLIPGKKWTPGQIVAFSVWRAMVGALAREVRL